jgi:signal transduction histidine kinase
MTFRSRLLVVTLVAVLLPLLALAFVVRLEMTERLTSQYERRVDALVEVIEDDLAARSDGIAASLEIVKNAAVDDNRFRRAAVDRAAEERRYLLDYAGGAMRLTGLSMLQIQDASGRIMSSGHFRNEFDRLDRDLPRLLAAAPGGTALIPARAPDEPFLALARVDSFRMGGNRFWIVAGIRVEQRFLERLARGSELSVTLVYPGGEIRSNSAIAEDSERDIVRELAVPFAGPSVGTPATAMFRVSHGMTGLRTLRRSIDLWFLAAVAAAVVLAVSLAGWLASRFSHPLMELADKTSRIDLDRLDVDFDTDRNDEVGALSRLLAAMTVRLRASAHRIRDAERRATVGELARQVNHDIKNGLTPIRNVFRHLFQVAEEQPGELSSVFDERKGTLDSGMTYLENLASKYARLHPRPERRPCDVNEIVRNVVADLRPPESAAVLRAGLCDAAVVMGDPLSIRRVLENLVGNAIDSLGAGGGEVVVSTALAGVDTGDSGRRVRITVADTGAGMSDEEREKVFEDFYTTKVNGTGLGLSIVRRLVMDLDGALEVESKAGQGSRFVVDLPAVES